MTTKFKTPLRASVPRDTLVVLYQNISEFPGLWWIERDKEKVATYTDYQEAFDAFDRIVDGILFPSTRNGK